MKKILFLGDFRSGGSERQMVTLAIALKQRGYDVSYFSLVGDGMFMPLVKEVGIPVLTLKKNRLVQMMKLSIPYDTLCMRRIFREGKYDTAVSFLGFYNFVNCFYAHKKHTKHRAITGLRNNRDEVFLDFKERNYTHFERYADIKVSNSNSAKERFTKLFPVVTGKMITIYNAVTLPEITSTYAPRKNERLNVVVPASYREVKNPMGLCKALDLMSDQERKSLHVVWYGSLSATSEVAQLRAYIAAHHLDEVIEVKDATLDIANKMNEADAIGLFSSSEGLPNAVCEGMMIGKAIVMSRVSDYDILVDENNGALCDWDNPEGIRQALLKLAAKNADEIVAMGQASQHKAERLFAPDVVVKQWEEIL